MKIDEQVGGASASDLVAPLLGHLLDDDLELGSLSEEFRLLLVHLGQLLLDQTFLGKSPAFFFN